jgi:hypothetical protein
MFNEIKLMIANMVAKPMGILTCGPVFAFALAGSLWLMFTDESQTHQAVPYSIGSPDVMVHKRVEKREGASYGWHAVQ